MGDEQRCAKCVDMGREGHLRPYGLDGVLWCPVCQLVYVPADVMARMDALDRARRLIERGQEEV